MLIKHNSYYIFLKSANKVVKSKLFIYYYVIMTCIAIYILLIQSNQTQPLFRYFLYFMLFWVLFVVSCLNTILSSVSLSIHKLYPLLCGLFAKHSSKMNINLKYKLINLLEKLSKMGIGFTCYDCFTFCYFELFIFCFNLMSTYMLFYELMNI
jgi:hypothetical protein